MPPRHFWEIPAVHKWFKESSNDPCVTNLDHAYLEHFQDVAVPLEYTRLPGKSHDRTFYRAKAPLSIFLTWARTANFNTVERFYLAQASVSTLPEALRNDLPTPNLVARAGKGDVYDTNIWMGVPPTYTPLHRDPNPNLLVQLAGSKTVRLLSPDDGRRMYAEVQDSLGKMGSAAFRGEEMMKGEEKTLLEARVWDNNGQHGSTDAVGFEARLGCGDGIFIPQGWWHSVKGIGDGMTASVSPRGGENWFFASISDGDLPVTGQLVVPLSHSIRFCRDPGSLSSCDSNAAIEGGYLWVAIYASLPRGG